MKRYIKADAADLNELSLVDRIEIAQNPATRPSTLAQLASDPELGVRYCVLQNPNTPKEVTDNPDLCNLTLFHAGIDCYTTTEQCQPDNFPRVKDLLIESIRQANGGVIHISMCNYNDDDMTDVSVDIDFVCMPEYEDDVADAVFDTLGSSDFVEEASDIYETHYEFVQGGRFD